MAIMSMTGFGRGEASSGPYKITVEISSVNRKQFDCNVSLPRELATLEAQIQAFIRQRITRGHVKASFVITAADPGQPPPLDTTSLAAHLAQIRAAAQALGLPDDLTAASLLSLPEITRPRTLPEDPETLWPAIQTALAAAAAALLTLRAREGQALERDLLARLDTLQAIAADIALLAPTVPAAYKATLQRRLSELLDPGNPVDEATLARETALFADRCDISEELTRLHSHFAQLHTALRAGGACGRTLDFLCQELFREINTTGSKANDAAITRLVIPFKAALEALREQVQNIE